MQATPTRLLLLACLGACAFPAAAASPEVDAKTIRQLSIDWMQAIERKDRQALEGFLAPGFVLMMPGDPADKRVARETWLANAIAKDWSAFRYENMEVKVHGTHAIASSHLHFRVSPMPFAFDSGVVDQWEKRDGRWQVTTRMLGESAVKGRIDFALGLLAAALAYGLLRLVQRLRRARS
jgi:ketosteroid isomerase-like protein